jgi:hypothetical protein
MTHETEIAKKYAAIYDLIPAAYDARYVIAKEDARVNNWEMDFILGEHQRKAAARREATLVDSTRSLFQRLADAELAAVYDRVYGRPRS